MQPYFESWAVNKETLMNMRSNAMNVRSLAAAIRTPILAAALVTGGALLVGGLPADAAWEYAHGDSANTGFAMVDTAPASGFSVSQAPLGSIAPGANPVIGSNGDVYVGNLQGELRAFHADGTPYWTRQLNSLHGSILAAPVVGADGSIYVVSGIHYTDHRDGVTNERNDCFLHKFTPGGGWLFAIPFPEQFSTDPTSKNRGATTAPPNIWRSNGSEAIIVPVLYKHAPTDLGPLYADLRLIAFSTTGIPLANLLVTQGDYPPVTVGGNSIWAFIIEFFEACGVTGCDFTKLPYFDVPLQDAGFPLPGVAIRPDPSGGPPFVMVTDGRHDKVAYIFSPQTGFSQVARSSHLRRQFTTSPVVLPNGDTLTGTRDGYLTRTGQNFVQLGAIGGLGTLTAAPTRLSDGGLVVVNREGIMTVQRGHRSQKQLAGESIASAAASCNHIFVASTNAFETFDARTLMQVAIVPWVGGGLHSPVIGPQGHVYAIAADTLLAFPPPWRPVWDTSLPSCALLPPTPGP